jgi:hypothetical protein
MNGLTASELLDLTCQGANLDWLDKGLLLAGYAWPESSVADRESLPVGVRDRLLLTLRIRTFGRMMAVRSWCPKCNLELEAEVDLGAILVGHADEPPETVLIEIDGEPVEVRLPSSRDLRAVCDLGPEEAERTLFHSCVDGSHEAVGENARQAVAEALGTADPLVNIELEFQCSRCGEASEKLFDILDCFWREIEDGARRTAAEVHLLASAYGWTESDILALSPARRSLYLSLVSR